MSSPHATLMAKYRKLNPSEVIIATSTLKSSCLAADSNSLLIIMASLLAKWTKLASSERLQRSSQSLSVIGSQAWIFGGELLPRQPVDNRLDVIDLSPGQGRFYTILPIPKPPSTN